MAGASVSRRMVALVFLVMSAVLGGCVSTPEQSAPPPDPDEGPPARSQPTPERAPTHALETLLSDSRAQLDSGQWREAIATAERGLRIDRREASLYLVLARAYRQLAKPERARQFARQGLRYVSGAGPVADALEALLED